MDTSYNLKNSVLYKSLLSGRKLLLKNKQVFQTTDYKESVILIANGYVKRYKINNNGTESIQGIYGPGNILPISWMLKVLMDMKIYSGPETFYYETITNAEVYTIRQDEFEELRRKDPDFYQAITYTAGVRLETYIHNFENVSLPSTEKRLAHQLVFHAKHFGEKTDKGVEILVPLKQKDLASLIDVTRETVSLNLKELRTKKLIKTSTCIIVNDVEALEEFAYS